MDYKLDLSCFMEIGKRCLYDLNLGRYKFSTSYKVDPKDVGDGVFKVLDENLYALAKTISGPIFIFNDIYFDLKKTEFKFSYELITTHKTRVMDYLNKNASRDFCRFIFKSGDIKKIDIVYEKPDEEWDSWNMDIDFFHWLTEWSNKDDFIEHFTK